MLTSRGTEALVALETAAPDVLFETLPGSAVQIWPQVRMMFAKATAEVELNSIAVPTVVSRGKVALRLLKAYLPERISRRTGQTDYCYLVSGVTTRITPHGSENWLVGDFASATAENSVIMQARELSNEPSLRPVFRNTISFDRLKARAEVDTRVAPLSVDAVAAVRSLVREASQRLEFPVTPEQVNSIEKSAVYQLSQAKHLDARMLRLLDRLQPRIVFMEDASYGSRANLIAMMKDRNITVVEPQHGWIGSSHGAYNFGAAMSKPELKRTLPDVLMTFGEFWSSHIRHPATVVAIGKPHLEAMAREAPPFDSRKQEVLVVSSVADPSEMAAFTLAVRDALPPGWRVRFRPHPSERASLRERYPTLDGADGVGFDENSDVYESLKTARGVVGVASTVLYEALAMGCHVFVKDSPFAAYYLDEGFGELVGDRDSISRMANVLANSASPSRQQDSIEAIWKPNSVANFLDHLQYWQTPRVE